MFITLRNKVFLIQSFRDALSSSSVYLGKLVSFQDMYSINNHWPYAQLKCSDKKQRFADLVFCRKPYSLQSSTYSNNSDYIHLQHLYFIFIQSLFYCCKERQYPCQLLLNESIQMGACLHFRGLFPYCHSGENVGRLGTQLCWRSS